MSKVDVSSPLAWTESFLPIVASTILHARIQPVMRPNLYQASAKIDTPWYTPPLAAKKGAILKASLFLKVTMVTKSHHCHF